LSAMISQYFTASREIQQRSLNRDEPKQEAINQ
jgi:hypothetical protein